MKPHKHAEMIIAWANGATIQYAVYGRTDEWRDIEAPGWCLSVHYRIKPEIVSYRVALFASGRVLASQDTEAQMMWERDRNFIKWLTPWTEVEL